MIISLFFNENPPPYKNYVVLDMRMPAPLPLLSLVLKVARLEGEIYVHCANGHGRSALGDSFLSLICFD